MDTNKPFSFSCVVMLVKRDLMENWKKNLYLFLGLYVTFLLACLVGWGTFDGCETVVFVRGYLMMFGILAVVAFFYSPSYILDVIRTKEHTCVGEIA